MKKNNKKGFTLAELLIVVAIIAVLVAIAIPVFKSQLDKAKEATYAANARATYAEAVVKYLESDSNTTLSKTYGGVTYSATTTDNGASWSVTTNPSHGTFSFGSGGTTGSPTT